MLKIIGSFCLVLFPCIQVNAQTSSIDDMQQRIIGVWQNKADTNNVLNIMSDYITVFDSGRVSKTFTYSLGNEQCNTIEKITAATGVYLIEIDGTKAICCALAEVNPVSLRVIYPGGKEVGYYSRKSLPGKRK